MEKIIFNYTTLNNEEKRLDIFRDTPITKEIIYSLLYLHSRGLIKLHNALPIMEVYGK